MLRKGIWLLLAVLGASACDESALTYPDDGALFIVAVENEQFRVRVFDAGEIAQGRALITSGANINVNGRILRGDGGINTGYGWHLHPETVEFVDATIELCDGMPSYVQAHIGYYVDTVKQYCPWGARVVSEVASQ
ncbi:MAG TPA: hypothetical protein VFO52_15655 [Longimicrobiales bacterium]|nr:hypothetical protein [Longimicrobiales bacterium]